MSKFSSLHQQLRRLFTKSDDMLSPPPPRYALFRALLVSLPLQRGEEGEVVVYTREAAIPTHLVVYTFGGQHGHAIPENGPRLSNGAQ